MHNTWENPELLDFISTYSFLVIFVYSKYPFNAQCQVLQIYVFAIVFKDKYRRKNFLERALIKSPLLEAPKILNVFSLFYLLFVFSPAPWWCVLAPIFTSSADIYMSVQLRADWEDETNTKNLIFCLPCIY